MQVAIVHINTATSKEMTVVKEKINEIVKEKLIQTPIPFEPDTLTPEDFARISSLSSSCVSVDIGMYMYECMCILKGDVRRSKLMLVLL